MIRKAAQKTDGRRGGRASISCRQFRGDLSDWIAGRLPAEAAARMMAHCDACPACARDAASERDLRDLFDRADAAARAAHTPDLWDRVAARIAQPAPTPRSAPTGRPMRPVFAFGRSRAFALGGALAAAAALAVWMHGGADFGQSAPSTGASAQTTNQVAAAQVDETHVLQLVSEMQALPDPDSEYTLAASGVPRREARTILFGAASPQPDR